MYTVIQERYCYWCLYGNTSYNMLYHIAKGNTRVKNTKHSVQGLSVYRTRTDVLVPIFLYLFVYESYVSYTGKVLDVTASPCMYLLSFIRYCCARI